MGWPCRPGPGARVRAHPAPGRKVTIPPPCSGIVTDPLLSNSARTSVGSQSDVGASRHSAPLIVSVYSSSVIHGRYGAGHRHSAVHGVSPAGSRQSAARSASADIAPNLATSSKESVWHAQHPVRSRTTQPRGMITVKSENNVQCQRPHIWRLSRAGPSPRHRMISATHRVAHAHRPSPHTHPCQATDRRVWFAVLYRNGWRPYDGHIGPRRRLERPRARQDFSLRDSERRARS